MGTAYFFKNFVKKEAIEGVTKPQALPHYSFHVGVASRPLLGKPSVGAGDGLSVFAPRSTCLLFSV